MRLAVPDRARLGGPDSEETAHQVADQCRELRIRCRVRAIDERDATELVRFPSLVAILPTFSDNLKVRTALEPFATLIADYRLRWPEGVDGVNRGRP